MKDPRARPTLFVPLVGLPMLFLLGGGSLAFGLHTSREAARTKVVVAAALADPVEVPHGTYVETEGTLEPGEGGWLELAGVPDVAVRVERSTPGPLRGRVCDAAKRSACGFRHAPDDRFGKPRVLAVGMDAEHSRALAAKMYAVAGATALVYVGLVAFSRRRRRGAARVVEERTWTLPIPAEEIRTRLRALEGVDRFLVVDEAPGRLVFLQGYSENAARGWGIRRADAFPRRATLGWKSSPREPTQVSVRVEEDLVWWPSALNPTMHRLAGESVAATLAGIQRALGVGQDPA